MKEKDDSFLHQLFKFIVSKCSLIVISTTSLDASYRIFSTINNRGLDLAPIDIIKSVLFINMSYESSKTKKATYESIWKEMSDNMDRDELGKFFSYIRFIAIKSRSRNNIYFDFESHIFKKYSLSEMFEDFFQPYAKIFYLIKENPYQHPGISHDERDKINTALYWLNRLPFDEWVAPTLMYMKRFQEQPQKILKFLQALERLSYFLLFSKANINVRYKRYATIMLAMEDESIGAYDDYLRFLELAPVECLRFRQILNGEVYINLKPNVCLLLLSRLEEILQGGKAIREAKKVAVEYVMPPKITRTSEWSVYFDNKDHDYWKHRLGNLVLLSRTKNSTSNNKDFTYKKEKYFTERNKPSPFVLTQAVCLEHVWNPAVLIERQKYLLSILEEHWQIAKE